MYGMTVIRGMAGMAVLSGTFVNPANLVPAAIMLAGGVVAAAAGVLLFRRALRGSRVGDVPHCPACDYVLTGLPTGAAGARCPECGAALDARPVPRGERRSEPFFAVIGFAVLLLAVPMLSVVPVEIYRHVNWYGLRRLETVLADAESPLQGVATRAWYELTWRQHDGVVLTPAQYERLVAFALARMGTPGGRNQAMENWLGAAVLDGRLSPAQRRQFFAAAASAAMRARPTALLGDGVPLEVTYQYSGPGTAWVRLVDRTIDGVPLPDQPLRAGDEATGATGVLRRTATIDRQGRHTIRATARLSIYKPTYPITDPPGPVETPLHQLDLPVSAEVEVLPAAPPDYIRRIRDDDLGPRLRASITADYFWYLTINNPGGDVSGELKVKNAPVAIAFDVFARVGGGLYPMGSFALGKGRSEGFIVRTDAPAVNAATEIDLVLRTSEEAARQTLNQFEAWDGELVFPGVTVRRLPRFEP